MASTELVFGLLDTSADIEDQRVARAARDLTLAWSRFKYFDRIIEHRSIDGILDRALSGGARYCLIQAYGHVLSEVWHAGSAAAPDVMTALASWIQQAQFLVTGYLIEDLHGCFGLDRRCLLVDLGRYDKLGRPVFSLAGDQPRSLVRARVCRDQRGAFERIEPTSTRYPGLPAPSGGNLVQTSLAAGIPVYEFPRDVDQGMVYLQPDDPARGQELGTYLGKGIANFRGSGAFGGEDGRALRFLDNIHLLTQNLRRAVFVWNLESYADVEQPPPGFTPPLSALYTVAAGFKPNRILHTHGFDQNTRVVVFDYSPQGLEFRRHLHEHWDGRDYPRFLRYLFEQMPASEAHYCLWEGVTPDNVNWDDIEVRWQDEVAAWGGADVLADHWQRFRQVRVDYLLCDILSENDRLLKMIHDDDSAVIWWSNAFFSVYSNWYYNVQERMDIYGRWIEALSKRAPRLYLYGSDANNISVNCLQAGEYGRRYGETIDDPLEPRKLHRHELRF